MTSNVFLLWHRKSAWDPDPASVAAKLAKIFQPVLAPEPTVVTRRTASVGMVYLEHAPRDWRDPFFEEDEAGWAVAPEYPLDARLRLQHHGAGPVLRPLAAALAERPEGLVSQMMPCFSLISAETASGKARVVNDPLGLGQLFEAEQGETWAVSNRLNAFAALGLSLRPVPEEWAARWALNFFPMELTGFSNVRVLPPGSAVQIGRDGPLRQRYDMLSDWVLPEIETREEHAERARTALIEICGAVARRARRMTLMFSGGRDSRAIASTFRAAGLPLSLQTGGHPASADALVASELARIAGVELTRTEGTRPEPTAGEAEEAIRAALLWEAGSRLTKRHKTFSAGRRGMHAGRIKVSGKHGEIGRCFYSKSVDPDLSPADLEQAFVRSQLSRLPRSVRKNVKARVEELVLESWRSSDFPALPPGKRLDFYYLIERTRRLNAGSHGAKSGIVFTPFLAPEFIRASFAIPSRELPACPLHAHIVARNSPDWAHVPYAADEEAVARMRAGQVQPNESSGDAPWLDPAGNQNYDNDAYWQTGGLPLVERSLASDGLFGEIFDRERARKSWRRNADEIVISGLAEQ